MTETQCCNKCASTVSSRDSSYGLETRYDFEYL